MKGRRDKMKKFFLFIGFFLFLNGLYGMTSFYTIPPFYDPMISKLIAWGRDRNEAIIRMRRALYEYIIVGIKTNIPFHKAVMENLRFIKGELGTHFIDRETTLQDDMKRMMEREKP